MTTNAGNHPPSSGGGSLRVGSPVEVRGWSGENGYGRIVEIFLCENLKQLDHCTIKFTVGLVVKDIPAKYIHAHSPEEMGKRTRRLTGTAKAAAASEAEAWRRTAANKPRPPRPQPKPKPVVPVVVPAAARAPIITFVPKPAFFPLATTTHHQSQEQPAAPKEEVEVWEEPAQAPHLHSEEPPQLVQDVVVLLEDDDEKPAAPAPPTPPLPHAAAPAAAPEEEDEAKMDVVQDDNDDDYAAMPTSSFDPALAAFVDQQQEDVVFSSAQLDRFRGLVNDAMLGDDCVPLAAALQLHSSREQALSMLRHLQLGENAVFVGHDQIVYRV